MKRLLAMLLLMTVVRLAVAYPITPQTLRKLIIESQCIIIASVDNHERITQAVKHFDKATNDTVTEYWITYPDVAIADLHIKEVLKGNPDNPDFVRVSYSPTMVCPAPANYPDKALVIAFLNKDKGDTAYYTCGLSYGSKIMANEAELNIYRVLIIEYMEILKITGKKQRDLATAEWLLKCVENKYTRWDGAYDLSCKGNYPIGFNHPEDGQFIKLLSAAQLQRIDSMFFSTDTLSQAEMYLIDLLPTNRYTKLRSHLLKNLEYADQYLADNLMKRILKISPSVKLQEILEVYSKISYYDKEREYKQRLQVSRFIAAANL